MEPRWDDLRLFLAAVDAGSLSGAARRLGLEQSTLSRRIAALEERLGGALFLRGRSGLVLTEHGARILPLAREAAQRIRELTEVADARVEGLVRIAATEALACYGLLEALPALYDAHPGLQVQLVTGDEVSDLTRREADLALRFVRPQSGALVFKKVAALTQGVWGTPAWAPLPFEALEWVELELGHLPMPETVWVRAHRSRPPRLMTNGYLCLLGALQRGLGVGVIPDVLGAQLPGLTRLEVPAALPDPLPLYLVAHSASRRTPRVAAVWDFLEGWAHERLLGASPPAR